MRKSFWSLLAFLTLLSACSGAGFQRENDSSGDAEILSQVISEPVPADQPQLAPVNTTQIDAQPAPQLAPQDEKFTQLNPVNEVQETSKVYHVVVNENEKDEEGVKVQMVKDSRIVVESN